MNRRIVAVFLSMFAASSALAEEWRRVAWEWQHKNVVAWRAELDGTIRHIDETRDATLKDIDRARLRVLGAAEPISEIRSEWEGFVRCRLTALSSRSVLPVGAWSDSWTTCRLVRIGSYWRFERRIGGMQVAGRFFDDPEIGLVFVGQRWGQWRRESDPTADPLAGVVVRDVAGKARVDIPGLFDYLIFELDLRASAK